MSAPHIETREIGFGPYTIRRSRSNNNILIITYNDNEIKLLFHPHGVIISDDTVDEEIPPSAPLSIQSNSGGLLIPRLKNSERNMLDRIVPGTIIFNITEDKFQGFTDLDGWVNLN